MSRFLHRNIKQGGTMVGRDYYLHCSKCGKDSPPYHTTKHMPDEPLRKRFKEWGWLLGRNAAHDVCPECLGVTPENRLARKFKTTEGGRPVLSPREVAEQAARDREQVFAKTDQVLARHMGKSDEPVDQPEDEDTASHKEINVVQPVLVQTGLTLEQTLALARALEGISSAIGTLASDMQDMAAAVQLLAGENEKMRNAVAQIVPAIHRQTDGLAAVIERSARTMADTVTAMVPIREEQPDAGAIHDAESGDRERAAVMQLERELEHMEAERPLGAVAAPEAPQEEAPQPSAPEAPAAPAEAPPAAEEAPAVTFAPAPAPKPKMTPQEAGRRAAQRYMETTTPEERQARARKAVETRKRNELARAQLAHVPGHRSHR